MARGYPGTRIAQLSITLLNTYNKGALYAVCSCTAINYVRY